MRKLYSPQILVASFLINIILLLAVIILSLPAVSGRRAPGNGEPPSKSGAEIDQQALFDYADDFRVSTEYLRLVLPDYLVYSDGGAYVFQPLSAGIPRCDYNWKLLEYDNGRVYYRDENYDVSYGIDVSAYQGEIDWQAVAADGVQFAFIRVGYRGYGEDGKLMADSRAADNLAGATAAGLDIGVYFFSQAKTEEEAAAEAELTLAKIRGYTLTYPVVFDMEEISGAAQRVAALGNEQRTACALAFCSAIENAGYPAMIYGNMKWLAGRLDLEQLTDYPLWFAQYYDYPLFPYQFSIWQYSASGTVAGISGPVDLNICFSTPWR